MYLKFLMFIFLPLFMYSNEKLENINIGYHNNINDITNYQNSRSALNIWVKDFAKNIYNDIDIKIYDNSETLISAYLEKKIDVIPIASYRYLDYKKELDKNTINYFNLKRSVNNEYLKMYLIVNKNSKINKISDLKDKRIGIDILNEFGKIFLEKTYLDSNKKNADNLISKVYNNNSNSLLLQTYFSKYDAAVITSFEYNTMLELNPAIKKKIKILKSSPRIFPYSLILFNKNIGEKKIKVLEKILKRFFSSEKKHELYDMLKIKAISPIEKKDLDKLDEYYKDYLKLKNKYK